VKTVFSYGIGLLMLLCVGAFADEAKQSTEPMPSTPAMQSAEASGEAMPSTGATQSAAPMQDAGAIHGAPAEQASNGPPAIEPKTDMKARIQAIVKSPEATYVEPRHCIPVFAYDNVEILNDQMLVFHGRQKDKLWLNQLAGRCPGLRQNMTLKFELHQDQACNLDTFNGVEHIFWFWQNTTGSCSLGKFQPVTPDQVNMVKDAIASAH
jgi:hypothetical protein